MTDKHWQFKKGHTPHNKGTGGCKRGHAPERWSITPKGIGICLDCARANGAKYRKNNQLKINWNNRAKRYGLSIEEVDAIFNRQRGQCAICSRMFFDGNYKIDHDHQTGKVRGLLCASCNTAIGLLQDSPQLLNQAAEYLIHNGSDGIQYPPTPPAPASVIVHYEQSETESYPGGA